jgi:hypothetical protein
MSTQCSTNSMHFKCLGGRKVGADFSGGTITSNGGVLLLDRTDAAVGLVSLASDCFTDYRASGRVEHSVLELVRQRVYGLALGYEDLNDHDELSRDPLLAAAVGKQDPTGASRPREPDRGRPLAGKSTLNRLELTEADANASSRYKKIALDFDRMRWVFPELFLRAHRTPPKTITLDFDATDDPLHGQQEGRFFHGYYNSYCYLPLYVFCGDHLLAAELRKSDIDGSAGSVEVLERLTGHIRSRWPEVRIIVRGDSGFARDEIMAWCEEHGVDYVFGLAKNGRLKQELTEALAEAKALWEQTGRASRVYKDFVYQTLASWSRSRRVVGKAEHLDGGPNPRFVVTTLSQEEQPAATLYAKTYCARGEMENRIKEQQMGLFADRTSTAKMRSNQIRLWFSSLGYVLLSALRRLGLRGTRLARARCDTIRLKLLRIGAAVRVSVRRVWAAMTSSFTDQPLFRLVWQRLGEPSPQPQGLPMRC